MTRESAWSMRVCTKDKKTDGKSWSRRQKDSKAETCSGNFRGGDPGSPGTDKVELLPPCLTRVAHAHLVSSDPVQVLICCYVARLSPRSQ